MSLAKSISEKNYPVKKKIANKDLLFVTKHKSAVQPTSLNCTLLWLFLVIRDTMTTRSFKLSPPNFNLRNKVPGYRLQGETDLANKPRNMQIFPQSKFKTNGTLA